MPDQIQDTPSIYTIALIGRPNVGKSTLFNAITHTRNALVAHFPGLTHDRQYARVSHHGQTLIFMDTPGLDTVYTLASLNPQDLTDQVQRQGQLALEECDMILFVLDAQTGLLPMDQNLAHYLRQYPKPILLVINKIDASNPDLAEAEFAPLGFQRTCLTTSAHKRGTQALLDGVLEALNRAPTETIEKTPITKQLTPQATKLAVVGCPNTGKSTLINRLLNEEKVAVSATRGTTRDCIATPFRLHQTDYQLLDTAGIRRRKQTKNYIEKLSVIQSLKAIEEADIVIALLDAEVGLTEQNLRLLSFILDKGCGLIIAVNKWDTLPRADHKAFKERFELPFLAFAPRCFISAKDGTGIRVLEKTIQIVHQSIHRSCSTGKLNQILTQAITQHPPPMVGIRRIKLRYAHIKTNRPLSILIHGKQVKRLPQTYKRYLTKQFRDALSLTGVPIKLSFKQDDNPYNPSSTTDQKYARKKT